MLNFPILSRLHRPDSRIAARQQEPACAIVTGQIGMDKRYLNAAADFAGERGRSH